MQPETRFVQLKKVRLHTRIWQPEVIDPGKPQFLLLHGLASNARTWDLVAAELVAAGFTAIAVDQRGHGLSTKPAAGYDFTTVTADLAELVEVIGLKDPILAGQSWGGNVVLEAAVHHPQLARGLVFVDGGFLQLRQRGSWDQVSTDLRPPNLIGMTKQNLAARIGDMHPAWIPDGVEITLGNFEILADGTVRPWLALENHMQILRALFDQDVTGLFPEVEIPVLVCPADDGSDWAKKKRTWVEEADRLLPDSRVTWFEGAAHDIHVDQPLTLAKVLIEFAHYFA